MKLIETFIIDSNTASFTINDIPQDFTHLELLVSARSYDSATLYSDYFLQFNNDTTTTYTAQVASRTAGLNQFQSSSTNGIPVTGGVTGTLAPADTFAVSRILIAGYKTAELKRVQIDCGSGGTTTDGRVTMASGRWGTVTDAIDSITFNLAFFAPGTTISLYGWDVN